MKSVSIVVFCVMALVVLVFSGAEAGGPKCDIPTEYAVCFNAHKEPPPSPKCCAKMKEQQPCYCKYMQNADIKRVFQRVEIPKMAGLCGLKYPSC